MLNFVHLSLKLKKTAKPVKKCTQSYYLYETMVIISVYLYVVNSLQIDRRTSSAPSSDVYITTQKYDIFFLFSPTNSVILNFKHNGAMRKNVYSVQSCKFYEFNSAPPTPHSSQFASTHPKPKCSWGKWHFNILIGFNSIGKINRRRVRRQTCRAKWSDGDYSEYIICNRLLKYIIFRTKCQFY